jgi:hypothetical protein
MSMVDRVDRDRDATAHRVGMAAAARAASPVRRLPASVPHPPDRDYSWRVLQRIVESGRVPEPVLRAGIRAVCALHNDRFPEPAVAEWSYAPDVDRATGGHFVELDLIVPALAAADPASRRQPWFPLAGAPRDPGNPGLVWARGKRSFVVVLAPP